MSQAFADTNNELAALAAQLSQPQGEAGIAVAAMMQETNSFMTRHAIEQLDLQSGQQVLEAGHGNCSHLAQLLNQAPGIRYTGVEISALMQQEATRINAAQVASGQAVFLHYEGLKLPFPDHHADRIFTVNTIYFWQTPAAFAAELYRVLKPGGLCAVTFAQASFMAQLPFTRFGFTLYNTAEVQALLAGAGFQPYAVADAEEAVRSKTGDSITRQFSTVVMRKAR